MKASELRNQLDTYLGNVLKFREDLEVCVVVKSAGSIGGTPVVNVKSISPGFDWDSGKMMIYLEEDVMRVNQKTIEDVRKEAEKIGWDMYENRNLKAEVKRLRKQLNDKPGL